MVTTPGFSYNYCKAITLSDTVSNLLGCRYLMNTGTSGAVTIRQTAGPSTPNPTTITAVPLYFLQGMPIECGAYFIGANSTSAGAGVTLVGFW